MERCKEVCRWNWFNRTSSSFESTLDVQIQSSTKSLHQVSTSSIRITFITDYFSGFALFLWIVISRLAGLLADKARVKAEAAAAKAQAESASRTAELLIDQQKEKEEKGEEGVEDDIKKEIADLKKRLEAVSNSCYS